MTIYTELITHNQQNKQKHIKKGIRKERKKILRWHISPSCIPTVKQKLKPSIIQCHDSECCMVTNTMQPI